MNKLETAYANELEMQLRCGLILWYKFEPMSFKLAPRTTYSPDFGVLMADGRFELRETKGHWQEDARAKIKIAAEMFPFQFVAIKRVRGRWEEERF